MMRKRQKSCLLLLSLFIVGGFTGCMVGPDYKRPTVNVPGTYRGPDEAQPAPVDAQAEQAKATAASLGDEKWWELFQDRELQALIRLALQNNYDLRVAAARVLEAQAQLGIVRADQYPSASASGGVTGQRSPQVGPIPTYEVILGNVTASAAWNLDFWGRYRRATEAARANLLANEWAQRQVRATLVASVAASYFLLRQLDLQLEISRRTLGSRRESLQLTQTLEQHGFNTLLDVRQAEQLVYTAAAEVPDLERQIGQQENLISILLGNNPGAIPRGLRLTEQPQPPEVPPNCLLHCWSGVPISARPNRT